MSITNFFESLRIAAENANKLLDSELETQQQRETEEKKATERQERENRRNWATKLLADGKVTDTTKVTAAMKILATDPEVERGRVEDLFLLHEHYARLVYLGVVVDFLKCGGDPAGRLGLYVITRALSEKASNLFDGEQAKALSAALEVLSRFNSEKRDEIKTVFNALRRKYPFEVGKVQKMPHSMGKRLYPEHYDQNGRCTFKFISAQADAPARELRSNDKKEKRGPTPRAASWAVELKDPDVRAGINMVANGQIAGVRLI